MKITTLKQGSSDWHQFRSCHFGASEAPSMMGESKFKSRNQLLHEKATGIVPEVNAATQRRFDDGHRAEELARGLAEAMINDDLYPATGEEGKLSASFDGLTLDQSTAWEHKLLNDTLRACDTAADLPVCYRIQMEQCLMLSGAQRCLFSATKWDDAGNLIEEKHLWYTPDHDLRDRLLQGWTQFAIDLENYVHVEHAEKPEATPVIGLPALFAQVEGRFNLATNIDLFSRELKQFVGKMDLSPTDDQGFADLEAQVKVCAQAEESIKAQVLGARGQMVSFDEFCKTAELLLAIAARARIDGTNAIKDKKVAIKAKAIADAKALFAAHVAGLEVEIAPIRLIVEQPDFIAATKGLKGLKSLHNEIDTALANGKIAANAIAKDVRQKLEWFGSLDNSYKMLFSDLQSLVGMDAVGFRAVCNNRITEYKQAEAAKLEAERTRIQAEEESKAKAAQDALLAAERAKMEAEVRAQAEEEAKQAQSEAAATTKMFAEVSKAEEAAAIEERRKQAQIADQIKPVRLSGAKTAVAQAIAPRRPNRAELLDAVATTFGTTNETALDWILQEFRGDIQHEEERKAA